MICNVIVYYKT